MSILERSEIVLDPSGGGRLEHARILTVIIVNNRRGGPVQVICTAIRGSIAIKTALLYEHLQSVTSLLG